MSRNRDARFCLRPILAVTVAFRGVEGAEGQWLPTWAGCGRIWEAAVTLFGVVSNVSGRASTPHGTAPENLNAAGRLTLEFCYVIPFEIHGHPKNQGLNAPVPFWPARRYSRICVMNFVPGIDTAVTSLSLGSR